MRAADRVIRIVQDTREVTPLAFPDSYTFGGELWTITVERARLVTADYSLRGWTGCDGEPAGIALERKADLDEIANNISWERERFEKEMTRMAAFQTALIVLESGSWEDAAAGNFRSRMSPASMVGSLRSLEERWRVPIVMAGSPAAAATHVLAVMRRFIVRKDREAKAQEQKGEEDVR